jgi:hypothetical protein
MCIGFLTLHKESTEYNFSAVGHFNKTIAEKADLCIFDPAVITLFVAFHV